jgi:diacylglycerol kinase
MFSCKIIGRSCKIYYLWSHYIDRPMVKKCASYNIGLRKIATADGGFMFHLLLTFAVISAGIYLKLNVLQWSVVAVFYFILLFTGIHRSATHLLTKIDHSISTDQAVRIKAMSTLVLTFTVGITFFTYLIIFMPKIIQLL